MAVVRRRPVPTTKDLEARKRREEEERMLKDKNNEVHSASVEREMYKKNERYIEEGEKRKNHNLDGFEAVKSKTTPRSVTKSGALSIVNSKSVKKVIISREVMGRMNNLKEVVISLSDDSVAIGKELPNNNNLLNINNYKGRMIIYSSSLVSEITDKYGLDFSNRTSITFSDVEYIQHNGFTIAIIKVK